MDKLSLSVISCLGLILAGNYNFLNSRVDLAVAETAANSIATEQMTKGLEILSQVLKIVQAIDYKSFPAGQSRSEAYMRKSLVLKAIAENYLEAGEYEKAIAVAKTMPDKREILIKIAVKYTEIGRDRQAIQLVTDNIADRYTKVSAVSAIADTYVKLGQKDKALQLRSQVQIAEPAKEENDLNKKIALWYASVGEDKKALEFITAIDRPLDKAEAFVEIAGKYAETKQQDKTISTLLQALQIAKTIEDEELKANVLGNIAVKYADIGQQDKANEILSQAFQVIAKNPPFDSSRGIAIVSVAQKYGKIGECEPAINILNKIKVFDILVQRPMVEAAGEIASKCMAANKKDKALEALSIPLQLANSDKDAEDKYTDIYDIADSYAKIGECDRAVTIADRLKDTSSKAAAFIDIAGKCIETNQKDKALEILSQALIIAKTEEGNGFGLVDGSDRLVLLGRSAIKYAQAGKYEQAFQMVESINSLIAKSGTLLKIAENYTKIGEKAKAAKTLSQAQEIANTITDEAYKVKTLTDIAGAFIKLDK